MFSLALNSLHRPLTRTYPSNTHSVLRTPVGCVTASKTPPTLLRGVPAFYGITTAPYMCFSEGGVNTLLSAFSFSYLLSH